MDAHVDVSVIIVNWNTAQLLVDVIDSLKSTTHATSFEVIVVDNASQDGSVEAVTQRHPDVVVIVNPDNFGFARANNIGFAMARGSALCLVNTDVIALDGAVDVLWDYLRNHRHVAAVGPRTVDREGRLRLNVRRFPSLRTTLGDDLHLNRVWPGVFAGRSLPSEAFESTHAVDVLSGCFLMVRREAVSRVGHLDEGFFFYGEDTDWAKRMHDAGWECVFHPQAQAIHFGGGSTSAQPVTYYLAKEKANLRYWSKHHTPGARRAYVTVRLVHNVASVLWWSLLWAGRPAERATASLKVRGNAANTLWLVSRSRRLESLSRIPSILLSPSGKDR